MYPISILSIIDRINPLNFLLDKVLDWITDKFLGVAIAFYAMLFNAVKEIVTDGLSDKISKTPIEVYDGSIYTFIHDLSNQFVLPIAIVFMSFFLVYELINTLLNDSKISDNSAELVFKWLFKYIISTILITYSFEIVNFIFLITTSAAASMVDQLSNSNVLTAFGDIDMVHLEENLQSTLSGSSLADVLTFCFSSFLASFIAYFLKPITTFILACRFVYIYIYLIMTPMAITTLPLKNEWGQIGTNYIKIIIAFGIQSILIVAVYAIFFGILASVLIENGADLSKLSRDLLLYSILLIFTLFKVESIAKSIVQAH